MTGDQLQLDLTEKGYWERRDAGINKATEPASPTLIGIADGLVRLILSSQEEAHCGNLWVLIEDRHPDLFAALWERQYMVNGRWGVASRRGTCVDTGKKIRTFCRKAHQKNTVWGSRIYQPGFDMGSAMETILRSFAMLDQEVDHGV
jgi:hypothetical protein